jgi:hypothetical protein
MQGPSLGLGQLRGTAAAVNLGAGSSVRVRASLDAWRTHREVKSRGQGSLLEKFTLY